MSNGPDTITPPTLVPANAGLSAQQPQDTLAAIAAAQSQMQQLPLPRLCRLTRPNTTTSYGFNLHADKPGQGAQQYIRRVDPESAADYAGLRENDRIIEVNGYNVEKETHKEVVSRVKQFDNQVELLVIDQQSDEYYQQLGIEVTQQLLDPSFLNSLALKAAEEQALQLPKPPGFRVQGEDPVLPPMAEERAITVTTPLVTANTSPPLQNLAHVEFPLAANANAPMADLDPGYSKIGVFTAPLSTNGARAEPAQPAPSTSHLHRPSQTYSNEPSPIRAPGPAGPPAAPQQAAFYSNGPGPIPLPPPQAQSEGPTVPGRTSIAAPGRNIMQDQMLPNEVPPGFEANMDDAQALAYANMLTSNLAGGPAQGRFDNVPDVDMYANAGHTGRRQPTQRPELDMLDGPRTALSMQPPQVDPRFAAINAPQSLQVTSLGLGLMGFNSSKKKTMRESIKDNGKSFREKSQQFNDL